VYPRFYLAGSKAGFAEKGRLPRAELTKKLNDAVHVHAFVNSQFIIYYTLFAKNRQ